MVPQEFQWVVDFWDMYSILYNTNMACFVCIHVTLVQLPAVEEEEIEEDG